MLIFLQASRSRSHRINDSSDSSDSEVEEDVFGLSIM